MCAVAVRQIKPDSYDEFRKAWQHDPWLPRYEKAFVFRRGGKEDEVMTMAFFDGTRRVPSARPFGRRQLEGLERGLE
jgi:hypothetical protein